MMTLTEYVKKSQNEGKDVSFSSLARDIPCDITYLAKIARGDRNPSYRMACRIENITNGAVPRTNWYSQDA